MKDDEMIKQIAEYYELPVEQIALIWSVIVYTCANYGESNEKDYHYFSYRVKEFIEDRMV
jgi:hypothetical protein